MCFWLFHERLVWNGLSKRRSKSRSGFHYKNVKQDKLIAALESTGIDLKNCNLTFYTHIEFFKHDAQGVSGMGSTRYDYVHAKATVDKTGDIQAIIEKRGRLSETERIFYVEGYLDNYIKGFYRSLRASVENWQLAPHLEAARSVLYGIDFLFASEGRITRCCR